MAVQRFRDFLQDERGSYTLWSLIWFMMYVAIGGLAVDGTDGYRVKTGLQATADAAALAAVMSVGTKQDPVAVAVNYAKANMPESLHGTVLKETDVHIGVWDFTAEQFTEGGSEPNAVYVVTQRSAENQNAVLMSMLRILQGFGLDAWWNIRADALAVTGYDVCLLNGAIAGKTLDVRSGNGFYNNMCLHGVEGLYHRQNNYFEPGVSAGVSCSEGEKKCIGPSNQVFFNDADFNDAWDLAGYETDLAPYHAERTQLFIDAVVDLAKFGYPDFDTFVTEYSGNGIDYSGLAYLSKDGAAPEYIEVNSNVLPPEALTADGRFKVYHVKCDPKVNLDLPDGTYNNIAVISTCPIYDSNMNVTMKNTLIAVDYEYPQNKMESGQFGLHMAGNAVVGNGDCSGGVTIMTTGSSVNFAAGAGVNNLKILSAWNIAFAAQANAGVGVHLEAVNDIDIRSESNFGLCPNDHDRDPIILGYSLVR